MPQRGALSRPYANEFLWGCMKLALAAAFAFSGMLGQEPSERQKRADLADAAKRTEEYIKTIRPYLFGNLPSAEAAIYKNITFRVTSLEATWKAASGKEDGERFVELDEGAARQMEILATALIIEKMQDRDVLIPYLRYVAMAMNRKQTFIKDVTVFAHVDPDEIDNNKARSTEQIAMVINGMAFLLAHEVGHHVLGHYDKGRITDVAMLRQMEIDADAWAIKRCLQARPHFSPLGGVLPLMFAYYTTPRPIAREKSTDHPAEVRRIHSMFVAMQTSLPEFRDEIISKGASYSEFRNFVNDMVKRYEREIEEDRPPVQELSPTRTKSTTDDGRNQDDRTSSTRRARVGAFCGDIYGHRYCPMMRPMPLGSACTCSNVPGWGVVVP